MKKPHWTDALYTRVVRGREDVVPKGWESAKQIAKDMGTCVRRAQARLDKLHKAGLVERKAFNVSDPNGRIRSTYFFRRK